MTVLVVEDEALIRELLVDALADAGLDVAAAADAEAALRVVGPAGEEVRPPCVLVTDIDLGRGMDGLALAAEMRCRWPGMGVVVMTGKPANLDGRSSDPREVRLFKPFALARLTTAVHDLMGRSRR